MDDHDTLQPSAQWLSELPIFNNFLKCVLKKFFMHVSLKVNLIPHMDN